MMFDVIYPEPLDILGNVSKIFDSFGKLLKILDFFGKFRIIISKVGGKL